MDAWGDDFKEPSKDEQSARRVLSLAIAFINARRPLGMMEIHREFYPQTSDGTFRKTFLRDRARLAAAGLALREGKKVDNLSTWSIDEEQSFVGENVLTKEDALALGCLLLPIASDPSFPYARDLRHALNKIDRSFDGTSHATIPPEARKRNGHISRMEDCMTAGHAAKVTYQKSDGTTIQRILAPYGFFFLHNNTYMVAARAGADVVEGEAPHTYNLNRVIDSHELPGTRYACPADFDVRDFIGLPFQMGQERYVAKFRMANGAILEEGVHDEEVAVSWAIAKGARPLAPDSLVAAWTRCLTNICEDGADYEQN